MIRINDAQRLILSLVQPLPAVELPLLEALDRVLAEDIQSPCDLPPADNSAMDGFAFAHAGAAQELRVTGFLPAGALRETPVPAGEAVRIMTGAPLPPGCDTVVPLEETEEREGVLHLAALPACGTHVRRRGEDVRKGDTVLRAGATLRAAQIGLLAALGKTAVRVRPAPRVAVLATGDELLAPGGDPTPGKIVDSNSHSIAAQLLEAGCHPLMLGIAPDDPEAIRAKLTAALAADAVITTGGASAGDCDYLRQVIDELGGEIRFAKVEMKPGKPTVFAQIDGRPVFTLPGNPVAAMVTFEQFVRPALRQMMGHRRLFRPRVAAVLAEPLRNKGGRPHFVSVLVALENGRYLAAGTGSQSSARISSLTGGNALLLIPPRTSLAAGADVEVVLLDRDFEMSEEPPAIP